MRVIIEVQSFVLADVPDANTADDVGYELCSEVETAIRETPKEGGVRQAHIDTHYSVWAEKDCGWLDSDRKRATDLLDSRERVLQDRPEE